MLKKSRDISGEPAWEQEVSQQEVEFYIKSHRQEVTCLQEEPRSNIQLQLSKPSPGGRAACALSGTERAARERHAVVRGSKAKVLGSRRTKQSNSQLQIQPLLSQITGSTHFSTVFSTLSIQ